MLTLPAVWLVASALHLAFAPSTHPVHMTHAQVTVRGGVVEWTIRCFADDLETALRRFSSKPMLRVEAPGADSVLAAYARERVSVIADGKVVSAQFTAVGNDSDPAGGTVRWFRLRYTTPRATRALSIRSVLLRDVHDDQSNVVVVTVAPRQTRFTLWFGGADTTAQSVPIDR